MSVYIKMLARILLLFATLQVVAQAAEPEDGKVSAVATGGTVATVHPLATRAGIAALDAGGNAVDAAVAAALTLGVVDGHNSGIGGGCFVLIHTSDGRLLAIDGREMAPSRASRDMYVIDGKAQPQMSQTGPLASGVPGALAAYWNAHQNEGRLSWRALVEPAAKIAADGFVLDAVYAGKLRATAPLLARFEGSRGVLLKPDKSPWLAGEKLRQPDLAKTYRAIAARGPAAFYRGETAATIAAWMSSNGGLLSTEDFASYRSIRREPVVSKYRGHTIVGFPPPSSGGIHVAQILNVLQHFDLKKLYHNDRATFVHVVAEAMKPAFADRAHWLGDADYAQVPKGLISEEYANKIAKSIDPRRAREVKKYGMPPKSETELFGRAPRHTTHIAAADKLGNWVGITATVNTTFGSKVIVPGTGVVLNNEMDDFSIQVGVPNAFGLIGAEANAIQPGKRPLSSMSPTIVLKDDRPVMTVGAAGGPKIITQAVLAIIGRIDLGLDQKQLAAMPRFHHQWVPDRLYLEEGRFAPELIKQLEKMGHTVVQRRSVGVSQNIVLHDGKLHGAHDPRIPGLAIER